MPENVVPHPRNSAFNQAVDMLEDIKARGGLVANLAGSLMATISPSTYAENVAIVEYLGRELIAEAASGKNQNAR